jgi:16S rRNA (uracil1498-N3)-methyltransferase
MTRPRIHIPAGRWSRRLVLLEPERRHLVFVLRLGPGDRVEVFDGEGHVCQADLVHEGENWLLSLGPRELRPDNLPDVRLGIALLKGKKLDSVVRMVTEVGVSSILPFSCTRSVPKADARRMTARISRFETIASEAARQSCRSSVPTVQPPRTLEEILSGDLPPFRAVLHEAAEGRTLSDLLAGAGPERLLLVGPEGGFTPGEIERAGRTGFHIARLDLPVLRAETAAVVAAALACLGPNG